MEFVGSIWIYQMIILADLLINLAFLCRKCELKLALCDKSPNHDGWFFVHNTTSTAKVFPIWKITPTVLYLSNDIILEKHIA